MRGVKRTVPLFIECQRPGCGQLKQVRSVTEQRKQKYCGRRCAALVHQNILRAERGKGGRETGRRRRIALMHKLRAFTQTEAFRLGYRRGFESAKRKLLARYQLVPRQQSGRAA